MSLRCIELWSTLRSNRTKVSAVCYNFVSGLNLSINNEHFFYKDFPPLFFRKVKFHSDKLEIGLEISILYLGGIGIRIEGNSSSGEKWGCYLLVKYAQLF